MQVIILTNRGRKARLFDGGGRGAQLLLPVLLLLVAGVIFQAGAVYGRSEVDPLIAKISIRSSAATQRQRQQVESIRRDVSKQFDALAARLGQLQAHTMRLDALGERLAKSARLDPGEFDFGSAPARGGPVTGESQPTTTTAFEIEQSLAELAALLEDRERKLSLVDELLRDSAIAEELVPSGRPVAEGWVSSGYGRRHDPISGRQAMHLGVDIAGKSGSDVLSVAAGIVVHAGNQGGFGRVIEIDHGNGYSTRYAHNRELLVKQGEAVNKGQAIAKLGSTGRSTGPHVHFEVLRDGRQVNPTKYLQAAR